MESARGMIYRFFLFSFPFLFSFLLYLNLDTFAWGGIIKSFSILDLQGADGEREDEGETSPRDIAFRYSLILFVGQSLSFGVP